MRLLRAAIGFAVSAAAVYLLARGVDWAAVWQGLRDADHVLIAATMPVLLLVFVMRSYRWRLIFTTGDGVGLWQAFKALHIGYMAANVLPLQMGELARVYALSADTQVPKARVLSTVAVERVLDVAVLVIAGAALAPAVGLPASAVAALAVVAVAVLAATGIIVVAVVDRPRAERWSNPFFRFTPAVLRPRARQARDGMLDGISTLAETRRLILVIAWTVASWAMTALVIYMLLQATRIEAPMTAAPFVLVVTTLAFLLPSSPGAVGVYDAAAVTALATGFGVDRELATSYALLAHAFFVAPSLVLGALFVVSMQLRARSRRPAPEPAFVADELASAPGSR